MLELLSPLPPSIEATSKARPDAVRGTTPGALACDAVLSGAQRRATALVSADPAFADLSDVVHDTSFRRGGMVSLLVTADGPGRAVA